MEIRSSAFFIGSNIPLQYTCDGENISPPLQWESPPPNTESFAVILEDSDAPEGKLTHWIVYNLPANCRTLPEGMDHRSRLPDGTCQGRNSFDHLGYSGPCPVEGTHRYFFKIYAIDRMLDLEPEATKEEFLSAIEGHVLDKAEVMGRYSSSSPFDDVIVDDADDLEEISAPADRAVAPLQHDV